MTDKHAAKKYDVVIIGGGVVGSAIALELSRYNIAAALLEKDSDVGQQTSSRNSGVSHSGFNYTPGSLRARLSVRGNEMLFSLTKNLGVEFDNIGKLTVARTDEDVKTLKHLLDQGKQNGVPDLQIVDADTIETIQPGAKGIAALYSPSSSIVNPYQLTINMAETAQENGVGIYLNTIVTGIDHLDSGFSIKTNGQSFTSKVLINCAGLYADQICKMLGIDEYKIYPCKGEYWILDRAKSDGLKTLVYPTPRADEPGLGIHLTPTTRGNIMIGPSAEYTSFDEGYSCTADVLSALSSVGHNMMPGLTTGDFIRHFSGLRPKLTPPEIGGNADFVIEDRADIAGFINTIGLESPGLTAAPAIAEMVLPMVGKHIKLTKKDDWAYLPITATKYRNMSDHERIEAVQANPNYGDIICRCEQVTRAELIAAHNNPLGATSLRSIKMRTGAMMGRCQSGFCLPKITTVLGQEFGIKPQDIASRKKYADVCPAEREIGIMNYIEKDIVIIGGGPAGLAATLGANAQAQAQGDTDVSILIIERHELLGGILPQCIHDGFGLHIFREILTGPEYSQRYEDEVKQSNIEIMTESYATQIRKGTMTVNSKSGYIAIKYKAAIFAMGCRERTAFNIGVAGTRPSGVYTAGTVQNLVNLQNIKVGSRIVIVGSGDIGLIMARRLTLEGCDVLGVYEILPYPSGLLRNVQQCLNDFDIPLHLQKSVTRIHGDPALTSVTISDFDEHLCPTGASQNIECDALILAVGLLPETELLPSGTKIYGNTKGAYVNENNMASHDGLFCCGNVLHVNDLVDWVSVESEHTGKCAYDYIMGDLTCACDIEVSASSGISYVTPNTVSGTKDVTFAMRVKTPHYDGGNISFMSDSNVLLTKHFDRLIPAEMVHIKLSKMDIAKAKEIVVQLDE